MRAFLHRLSTIVLRMRWPFLLLYVALVAGLVFVGLKPKYEGFLAMIIAAFVLQVLFLAFRGNPHSLDPVQPRELVVPLIVGSLMGGILLASMVLALSAQLKTNIDGAFFYFVLIVAWLFWGFAFSTICWGQDYLAAVRRIILALIGGSLLEFLATIPSHLAVARHPGCYLGRWPAMCFAGGIGVMFWAFGPGIVLLFMYEARRRRVGHCPGCAYNLRGLTLLRCPECGRPFTLSQVRMTFGSDGLEIEKPDRTK